MTDPEKIAALTAENERLTRELAAKDVCVSVGKDYWRLLHEAVGIREGGELLAAIDKLRSKA